MNTRKQGPCLRPLRSLQLLRILFSKPLLRRTIRLDLLPRQLLAELASSADLVPILQKEERNDAEDQTDEAKQTASPRNPKSLVHRSGSKRQHHGEQATRTRSRSGGTGGEYFVGVDEVVQEGHEDEQVGDSERYGCEDWHDPVD
jgi:hypothetical protein